MEKSRTGADDSKRQRIMDAALRLFSSRGYGDSTVPEIAREAGVAVGTIYNYFTGKQDLLVSLMMDRFLAGGFLEVLVDAGQSGEEEFLTGFFRNRIDFGQRNADNLIFLLAEVQRNAEVRKKWVEKVVHPTLAGIQSYLAAGMRQGRFRPLSPEIVSRAIAGMGIGYILLSSLEREESAVRRTEPQRMARDMAELLLIGLSKGTQPKTPPGY